MFDRLQERFEKLFRNLRGLGKIRESNISEALGEVRSSLLEADVQYRVAQSFVDSVRTRALGLEVIDHVDPGQQFVKVIYDEMAKLLGGGEAAELPNKRPLKILLMGLQGSGKTTTAAKLALYLKAERQYIPLLIEADTRRPAAREQLEQLAKQHQLDMFDSSESDARALVRSALKALDSREVAANCLVFDTAGRLHVDEALIKELREIREIVKPDWTIYVLDSMAGQDAVRAAQEFQSQVGFDGVIVTKLDGDARGGAALSVRYATGKPIYFVGMGEKVDALERLHPERMASRILGMGDIVSFVEKAQGAIDQEEALKLASKLRKNEFTIEDFQEQMRGVLKMGSLTDLVGYLPGGAQVRKALEGGLPEKEIKRADAIICSMTVKERRNPKILNGARRKRIAAGSGVTVTDVNRFINQFSQTRTMMSKLSRGDMKGAFPW